MDIDTLLAARVRDLRKAQGATLDQLAQRSGVSRSMISLIERGASSPTAAVLSKLAAALDVPLATLFDTAPADAERPPSPLARPADQSLWTDPASGYQRRHLTPAGLGAPLELVEVVFPAGQSVTFDNATRAPAPTSAPSHSAPHQQLWLLEGYMTLTVGQQTWQLAAGDCLAMAVNQPIVFANPGSRPARYVLALTVSAPSAPSARTLR